MQGRCMDAMRTLQDQEHRTRRLLAALDEHQHLVGVYQGSEEALAEHCWVLQQQVAEVHADRAEIHASLLVRCLLPVAVKPPPNNPEPLSLPNPSLGHVSCLLAVMGPQAAHVRPLHSCNTWPVLARCCSAGRVLRLLDGVGLRSGCSGGGRVAVQEARETTRRREAETAGRWSMLSESAAAHFEAAGATLEQLTEATSALVALKQAQEECVAGWGAAAEAAAGGLRTQGTAALEAAPDGEALVVARDKSAEALRAATEPVVEALEGVLQKQEALQVRLFRSCKCCPALRLLRAGGDLVCAALTGLAVLWLPSGDSGGAMPFLGLVRWFGDDCMAGPHYSADRRVPGTDQSHRVAEAGTSDLRDRGC